MNLNFNNQSTKAILQKAIDFLTYNINPNSILSTDLHNEIYNTDYFIIGYYAAEQFLYNSEHTIFGAIELIKNYEVDNFGEVSTDFSSSERVCNMYTYILGEHILSMSNYLNNYDEDLLNEDAINNIKNELETIY
jgi:hypothetical protein